MRVSIVIPVYNMWHLTHQRLMELRIHAPEGCEIIIVDDASTEDFARPLAVWQKTFARDDLPIKYYRNHVNQGFGGTCNVGAKLAAKSGSDVVVFLSNDVMVSGDFITLITDILTSRERVLVGGRVLDDNTGWNTFFLDQKPFVVPYCEGWLVACTVAVWKELGGFDSRYGRFDFEDVDLSLRAMEIGCELVGLNSLYLKHISGATISTLKVDRMAMTEINKTVFIDKWRERIPQIFELLEGA